MYDLAIIGGGPAGYSAALEAAGFKLRVILFEMDQLGGTCLNRGCVPTKYFAHMARNYWELRNAALSGIMAAEAALDFKKMACEKNRLVASLRDGLTQQIQNRQIEIKRGEASIAGAGSVVCDGQRYDAKNILIATGSKPAAPLLAQAISSDALLETESIPPKVHILGGGVSAVEFANIFRMFGSKVTVSIRGNRILKKWDTDISAGLMQAMKRKGIVIQKNCDFDRLAIEDGAIVLSAVGREANVTDASSGIYDLSSAGGIIVDSYGRTKTQGVFAAGDVTAESPQLAHVGMAQGRRAAQYIAGKSVDKEAAAVKCIYTDIETASVGLTASDAAEMGLNAVAAKQGMYSNARTLISTPERGFIKLVADRESHKLIGAQLMCERAGDIVAELALAINEGITIEALQASVRPHPSYCEAVTDAARRLMEQLL